MVKESGTEDSLFSNDLVLTLSVIPPNAPHIYSSVIIDTSL